MMDIYTYLKKDHQVVDDLFDKVLSNPDPVTRRKVFGQIKREIILHGVSEQATFYRALEECDSLQGQKLHDEEEQKNIKRILNKLDHTDIQSSDWMVEFKNLVRFVTHHMQEEESDIFKRARQVLSKQSETALTKEIEEYKRHLLGKMTKI